MCKAVIFCFIEPIGTVPPRMPIKEKIGAALGSLNNPLVLPCDAQAFPIPLFRYILLLLIVVLKIKRMPFIYLSTNEIYIQASPLNCS